MFFARAMCASVIEPKNGCWLKFSHEIDAVFVDVSACIAYTCKT